MTNLYEPDETVMLPGVGEMTLKTAVHCVLSYPDGNLPTIYRNAGRGDTLLDLAHAKEIATRPGFESDEETVAKVAHFTRRVR